MMKELNKMKIGTTFIHDILGKCWIEMKNNIKHMEFENKNLTPIGLITDNYPWDIPMEIIEEMQKELQVQ